MFCCSATPVLPRFLCLSSHGYVTYARKYAVQVNSYYDVSTKRSNVAMLLEKYGPNRVKFFEGDLCDAPFITRIFETEGVEWVVHMAARAGVRPSIEDPFVYVHSNVEATTRLLELSRLHGVKSFVFASSSSVYGGSQKEVREGERERERGFQIKVMVSWGRRKNNVV